MPSDQDILWFKKEFGQAIREAVKGTPFSLDMLTAIACQETGYIWQVLLRKKFSTEDILRLCVGDTIDAKPNGKGRSEFPKNKSQLLTHPKGAEMFAIARQSLEDMAKYTKGYEGSVRNPNKFCHGFGIFQYDLQYFKTENPAYFLDKKWCIFDECLAVAIGELFAAMKRMRWQDKKSLTDLEMTYVAIAYNAGSCKPALGLKQGHMNDQGEYYGELLYGFLLRSKRLNVNGPADAGVAGAIVTPRYRVNARRGLNLRGGPSVNFPVLTTVAFGSLVSLLSKDGEWGLVDLQGDGKADGHMHTSFLDQPTQ